VDARAVADARAGGATFPDGGNGSTGGIIDTQTAVGGWPELQTKPAPEDGDRDGMADEWEVETGLDPKDPADGATFTIDRLRGRYTNLELYLHWLVQETVEAQNRGSNYTTL
jgi:hypothetical protein